MWLVGVVVRRYIDILTIIINFPYSTCISSFFGSSIPTSLFMFKMFSFLIVYVIFVQTLLKEHSRSFKKSRSREYNYLIISIIKNVERASATRARESRDFLVRGIYTVPNVRE